VKSRDSSVGIALGYGLDDRVPGFDSRRGLGIFLFTTASRTALGPTQPPIKWVAGALSLGVKRPGREANYSLHLVPRSKNEWSYTFTPPIRLHGVVLRWSTGTTLPLYLFTYFMKQIQQVFDRRNILNILFRQGSWIIRPMKHKLFNGVWKVRRNINHHGI
jgi:hypothetical protein